MAIRVVMVKFKAEVTEREIEEFSGWLRDLASRVPYLLRMQCGRHLGLASDTKLSENAPNVVFGDYVSIWEFASSKDVDRFVTEPFHHEVAGKNFRRIVEQRYVINIP